MYQEHDFHYAMENTRVVVSPQTGIETFGTTRFHFSLVSELLDEVDTVRIRNGRIEAERPRIVAPQHFSKMLLEGFGENARDYADWVESNGSALRILRYGFQFRKTDLSERVVHEPMEAALDRLKETIAVGDDPFAALIAGVDDAWEVCLLKFSMEMIQRSAGGNMEEWKRRGLI
ncbi:MAG: hypothetical protein ACOYM3_09365 [Terrimicrobiaceae bacterium]